MNADNVTVPKAKM